MKKTKEYFLKQYTKVIAYMVGFLVSLSNKLLQHIVNINSFSEPKVKVYFDEPPASYFSEIMRKRTETSKNFDGSFKKKKMPTSDVKAVGVRII